MYTSSGYKRSSQSYIMTVTPGKCKVTIPSRGRNNANSQGKVRVSYNSPEYLQERHGVPQELMQNIAVVGTLAAKAGE
jgi:hypothetical protein